MGPEPIIPREEDGPGQNKKWVCPWLIGSMASEAPHTDAIERIEFKTVGGGWVPYPEAAQKEFRLARQRGRHEYETQVERWRYRVDLRSLQQENLYVSLQLGMQYLMVTGPRVANGQ